MTSQTPRCLILGGGGHARVLIDGLLESGAALPVAVLDEDPDKQGGDIYGVPVLGGDERLQGLRERGVGHFLVGLGSIRDNQPRRRLFEMALAAGFIPLTFQHPSAVRSPRAALEQGCQLFPLCVVNAGARLGQNVIVNTMAVVEHDCQLGDHVHVATGARLCSTVRVGDGAHVGAGATVKQLVSIGPGSVVAAGAVVIKDVPAGSLVAGVPARPLGQGRPPRS
ncbi:MAG: acetyltransferase [Pseudomonadota bacterium]